MLVGLAAFVVQGGVSAPATSPALVLALLVWAGFVAVRVARKLSITGEAPVLVDVELGLLWPSGSRRGSSASRGA
ncbi:MAG: hypothetical protein U0235_16090 [Polyangiaceae bacterium]